MVRGTFIVPSLCGLHVDVFHMLLFLFLKKRSQTSVRRLTCSDESMVPLKDSSSIVLDVRSLRSSWSCSSCSLA